MRDPVNDPFHLERFVAAQRDTYDSACEELRRGRKTGHWMWFIFPQIAGLGMTAMSQRYAITSLDEAAAYLAHSVLGPRLRAISAIVVENPNRSANGIFGSPDDLKLRSSMTLFAKATQENGIFLEVLRKFYAGAFDERTLQILHQL